MKKLREKFNSYMEQLKPDFIGETSLEELLFQCCTQNHPLEDSQMREDFKVLEAELQHLSLDENNHVFNLMMALCEKYARSGFYSGFEVGVKFLGEIGPLMR